MDIGFSRFFWMGQDKSAFEAKKEIYSAHQDQN
jgi:hypothetical protein